MAKNKNDTNGAQVPFLASLALFISYLFVAGWSVSLQNMGLNGWFNAARYTADILCVVCSVLAAYAIFKQFKHYCANRTRTIVLALAVTLCAITMQSFSIVFPMILGIAAINISTKNIMKAILVTSSVFFCISSVLSFAGVLTGGDHLSKPLFGTESSNAIMMSAFGLSNPNVAMFMFVPIIYSALYLCSTKRELTIASICLAMLSILISTVSGSSTGLILSLSLIILMNLARHKNKIINLIKAVVPYLFLIITGLTFFVAVNYGPKESLPNDANNLLTTRPYNWNLRVSDGSYINAWGDNDNYEADGNDKDKRQKASLDNTPLYTLVHYGALVYCCLLLLLWRGAKSCNNTSILSIMFVAILAMFVERMYFNSMVLLFAMSVVVNKYIVWRPAIETHGEEE